jgi:hypothetical protein
MPDNYNYKMSDLEYNKYKLKQSVETGNQEFLDGTRGKKQEATIFYAG